MRDVWDFTSSEPASSVIHSCVADNGAGVCLWLLWARAVVTTSADGIALPQKVLFPPERLTLRWSQAQHVGAGLQNIGNTCFLNAALQCLSYTPPLANYMLTREHSKTCNYSPQTLSGVVGVGTRGRLEYRRIRDTILLLYTLLPLLPCDYCYVSLYQETCLFLCYI